MREGLRRSWGSLWRSWEDLGEEEGLREEEAEREEEREEQKEANGAASRSEIGKRLEREAL